MDDAPPKIRLERLPKRDAVTRLRTVYACLERGWRVRQQETNPMARTNPTQQEEAR
jgi:hypothetical protein